jgi:hypothetical protein
MANAAPKKRPMKSRKNGLKHAKRIAENQRVIKNIESALLSPKVKG